MKNQKKSRKFLTAVLVLLFLAVGMFLGSALFGRSLLMVIFGFLVAGLLGKIWDRGMKPSNQRQNLDGHTIMQTRLWWLLLLGMWDAVYRIAMNTYASPTNLGRIFLFLTLGLTVLIPILKLTIGPAKDKKERKTMSLNL